LPPGRWDEIQLADWLGQFIGHGSDLDVPLRELPRMSVGLRTPTGDTDVILITDAQVHVPAEVRDRFLDWKRASRVRAITLVIDSPPGDLTAVADEVHLVASLEADDAAIGRVLSI
jgi:uncharacterized protein with von Willebrand factor type A (vWA) domain